MASQSLRVFELVLILVLSQFCLAASNSQAKPCEVDTIANSLVSLAPSNTELVFAIGAEDKLKGVCRFCDYPQAATTRKIVGTFTSANVERLAQLKPEIILLVNGQEALAEMLGKHGFRTVMLNNTSLLEIGENLRIIGRLTGHFHESDKLAGSLKSSLSNLGRIIASDKTKPRIFYCVWPQPLLTVGQSTFLNDVITASGGINIAGQLKAAYPHFSMERLVLANPDVIVLPYEAQGQSFLSRQPWISLQAVKTQHVYFLPDSKHNYLARPTPRVIDGLFWLAVRLHPGCSRELNTWFNQWQQTTRLSLNTNNLAK